MLLFTPLAGLLISPEIFVARSIVVVLLWAVVLLLPYVLTQRRGFYVVAVSLLFVDGLVNLFHWIVLRCPLNASSIFVFFNTNFNEASEFMAIKATPLLLLLLPYIALYVLTLRHIPTLPLRTRGSIIVWPTLWLVVSVYFVDNMVSKSFLRLAVPDVERAFISFFEESKEYHNLKQRPLYPIDTQMNSSDSTVVVVIIGESVNRNHMSLYGYQRVTTPRLAARTDIMAFDNVISANSNTLRSVMYFMTENNAHHNRPIDSCIHLFDVFHSSPYTTYWLSNQSPIGLWDNGVTNLASNADVKTFVNITANSSKESAMMASYDQNLFAPLQSALADDAKHKLIFLHLMGCHTQYSKRYPASFARYDEAGDKRTRTINTYDNAVYYNDYIVDSLFNLLAAYSNVHIHMRISALYFADHGEHVFDQGDYAGHDYADTIPHTNVEIPFIFWFSDTQSSYLHSRNPQLAHWQHTPYMIDDLFHTIIDLASLEAPVFDKRRSFVNPDYDTTRQRLLEDGTVYL